MFLKLSIEKFLLENNILFTHYSPLDSCYKNRTICLTIKIIKEKKTINIIYIILSSFT